MTLVVHTAIQETAKPAAYYHEIGRFGGNLDHLQARLVVTLIEVIRQPTQLAVMAFHPVNQLRWSAVSAAGWRTLAADEGRSPSLLHWTRRWPWVVGCADSTEKAGEVLNYAWMTSGNEPVVIALADAGVPDPAEGLVEAKRSGQLGLEQYQTLMAKYDTVAFRGHDGAWLGLLSPERDADAIGEALLEAGRRVGVLITVDRLVHPL